MKTVVKSVVIKNLNLWDYFIINTTGEIMTRKRGSYLGGSTIVKAKSVPYKTNQTARLKAEFLDHPTAQYKMSFRKFKNLRLQGKKI